MREIFAGNGLFRCRLAKMCTARAALVMTTLLGATAVHAQESVGGEANLKLPDLSQVTFLASTGTSC